MCRLENYLSLGISHDAGIYLLCNNDCGRTTGITKSTAINYEYIESGLSESESDISNSIVTKTQTIETIK